MERLVGSLPWLVAYGASLGPALLVVCIVIGALIGACWTGGAARLLAAWQCARLGPPLRRLEVGMAFEWAVLEGVVRFVDGQRCVELADGTLVELSGPTRGYLRARGSAPFVLAGDRVRVAGILEPSVVTSPRGGYRGTTQGWRLVPAGTALEIVLFAPRAVLGNPTWRACSALAGGALAALLVSATFEVVGRAGEGDVDRIRAGDRAYLTELAAADPAWRDTSLDRFEQGYRARLAADDADDETVDRLVAISALRGGCEDAALILLKRGRAAEALATAVRCRGSAAREVEAMAAYEIGNFRDASEAWRLAQVEPTAPGDTTWWPRAQASLRAHILAAAWDTATSEAQRFAAAGMTHGARGERLRCLAAALAAAGTAERNHPRAGNGPRDPVAQWMHCWVAPLDDDGGTVADRPGDWVFRLAGALAGNRRHELDAAAASIPLPERDNLVAAPAGALRGMAPTLEEHLLRALDEVPTVAARAAAAKLAVRLAAFEGLAGAPHGARARSWLALAHHRLREARETADVIRRHDDAVRVAEARPHRYSYSGCMRRREPPLPPFPRMATVPLDMALEDPRRDEPLAAFLEAEGGRPEATPALFAALEATRVSLDPLEASIRRLERGVLALCGSAALQSRRMLYDRRAPTWQMSALEAMHHQAVVAGIGEAMVGGDAPADARRPRADARLAAERLRDALRATDVGLLVGVLDSL